MGGGGGTTKEGEERRRGEPPGGGGKSSARKCCKVGGEVKTKIDRVFVREYTVFSIVSLCKQTCNLHFQLISLYK